MAVLKILTLFLISIAAARGAWQGGLKVRFDVGLSLGTTFFIDIPKTVADAVSEGWTLTERPEGPLPELIMYCYNDYIVCVMFDDTEFVAGMQISLPKDQYTDSVFDWNTQGFQTWTITDDGETKDFWAIQQYFVTEETLQISKEDRLAARDSTKILQEGFVSVTGFNGELMKISTNLEDIAADDSLFTKQACIPWMGCHYYYNMSDATECSAEKMLPWFPLVDSGELIAMGLITYGKLTVADGARNWFETPGSTAVKVIVPNGPECLYNLADDPGLVTMHIYYIEQPWLVFSVFQ